MGRFDESGLKVVVDMRHVICARKTHQYFNTYCRPTLILGTLRNHDFFSTLE